MGGVVGCIEATVNTLQTAGQEKIAEALKALAEAIAGASSMPDDVKGECLELVSAVGDELSRPTGERRTAVLRGPATLPKSLALNFDKVYAAYEIFRTLARASTGQELP